VATLVGVVLATAVLPPAGAWWLNGRRVQRTLDRATAILAVVAQVPPGPLGAVICGPGGLDVPTDAWGNCFLINDTWVISAGPNGALETPPDALALVGDDVGVRRP